LYRRVTVAKLLQHLPTKLLDLRGARAGQDQVAPDQVFPKAYVALEWSPSSVGGIEYPALVYRGPPRTREHSHHCADFRLPDLPHADVSHYGRRLLAPSRVDWQCSRLTFVGRAICDPYFPERGPTPGPKSWKAMTGPVRSSLTRAPLPPVPTPTSTRSSFRRSNSASAMSSASRCLMISSDPSPSGTWIGRLLYACSLSTRIRFRPFRCPRRKVEKS